MQLAKNPVFHAHMKHIEVHYHFVCERVLSSEVELWYIRTDRQVDDIFTKALGLDKLQHFAKMLGLQHLDVPHFSGTTSGRSDGKNNSGDDEPEQVSTKVKRRAEE